MRAMESHPVKTREFHNHHIDSTVWNRFPVRDDDIIVSTYGKSGTTWTQQIVGQLVFRGDPDIRVAELSPWLDMRIVPEKEKFALLAAQTHRRFIKTHLPLDAFVFHPQLKHIYIARDGRDSAWSFYNHHCAFKPEIYNIFNNTPGRVGPPLLPPDPDIRRYFIAWMENDGWPMWSFWDNARTWWTARRHPSVLMLHFADMKKDLEGAIRRIAAFLDIDVDRETFERVVKHSSFDFMKRHADHAAPLGGAIFEGGAGAFINKGTNGRWRDVLTAEDIARYEDRAVQELGPECARWLAEGGPIDR